MMDPVLRVRSMSVTYQGSNKRFPALKNVSVDVYPAQITAILGESGSGKSTFAMAVANLGLPSQLMEGVVELDGRTPRRRGVSWDGRAGFVFQDSRASFDPLYRVGRQLSEIYRATHVSARNEETRAAVLRALADASLSDPQQIAKLYPHQMSGGMVQRVGIAAALVAEPSLIIADEPTSALDATSRVVVLEAFKQLTSSKGIPVLWITHDIDAARAFADTVIVLKDGCVVEAGAAASVFESPSAEYTRKLLAACPTEDPNWLAPRFQAQMPPATSGAEAPWTPRVAGVASPGGLA